MAYSVVTTPAFDGRLSDAVAYRASYVGTSSARRLLDAFEKLCLSLSQNPLMGTSVRKLDRIPSSGDLRWVRLDSYVIIYHVSREDAAVTLEDMFYGSSNWRSYVER